MMLYAVLMFSMAVLFAAVGILIYRGKTNLIHDYHQTKVKDKVAYGRAFGKALGVLAITFVLSGILALLSDSKGIFWMGMAVLLTGFAIGIICIVKVQKKYNGGMF